MKPKGVHEIIRECILFYTKDYQNDKGGICLRCIVEMKRARQSCRALFTTFVFLDLDTDIQ